jgi:hypothetical protein
MPWIDVAALCGAPRIDTVLGVTHMVRPERLGRRAEVNGTYPLRWRLRLRRAPSFRVAGDHMTLHVAWDPRVHLQQLMATCSEWTGQGSGYAA